MIYKVFSKIISTILALLLPRLLLNQECFVKRRTISENLALAQELTHSLGEVFMGGNLIIKVDMAKDFDMVDWDYLT